MPCDYCYQIVRDTEILAVPNSKKVNGKVVEELIEREVCRKCQRKYLLAVPTTPEAIANSVPPPERLKKHAETL